MNISAILQQVIQEIRGAWRFRWVAIAVAWAVCLLGWFAVLRMDDIYEAGARVFVDPRTSLRPVLEGLTIEQDVESQLNLVRQSILGRPQLERVAEQLGMFEGLTTSESRARVVDGLQARIAMGNHRSGDRGSGSIYFMTYKDTDRSRAIKLLEVLTTNLRDSTLGGKQEGSEAARSFLRSQIQEKDKQLSEAEQRLADFKKRHVGMMPGAQGDYFSRLQQESEALKGVQDNLRVALDRREELARQLRGGAAGNGSGVAEAMVANGATAGQIAQAEAQLNELRLRFTERHPDVVETVQRIETLRQRQADELAALRQGATGAVAGAGATSNALFQSVQLALNQVDVEIASLRGNVAQRERRINELRQSVDTAPEVEAELARLNRDYDVVRAQYTALVDRLQRAELGEVAEQTEGMRFDVIDPPSAPFEPSEPKRARMLVAVLLLALGAGGGIAWLLHQIKPVFQSMRSLAETTGLPVLGAVSSIAFQRGRGGMLRAQLAYFLAAFALLACFVAVLGYHQVGVQALQRVLG